VLEGNVAAEDQATLRLRWHGINRAGRTVARETLDLLRFADGRLIEHLGPVWGAAIRAACRGSSAAHGEASNEQGPAQHRARGDLMGVRRQGLEPRTVALRELSGRSPDVRRPAGERCLAGHSLTAVVRC
jgi:hypothetical protein